MAFAGNMTCFTLQADPQAWAGADSIGAAPPSCATVCHGDHFLWWFLGHALLPVRGVPTEKEDSRTTGRMARFN